MQEGTLWWSRTFIQTGEEVFLPEHEVVRKAAPQAWSETEHCTAVKTGCVRPWGPCFLRATPIVSWPLALAWPSALLQKWQYRKRHKSVALCIRISSASPTSWILLLSACLSLSIFLFFKLFLITTVIYVQCKKISSNYIGGFNIELESLSLYQPNMYCLILTNTFCLSNFLYKK